MFRKTLFWLHLGAGSVAGIVILIMSVTGVMLAWQRHIIRSADRGFRHAPSAAQQPRLAPEALLARLVEVRHTVPATITLRSDPSEPASAEFGRNTVVYLNPWTGEVLGEGSASVRNFFREVENWHRWLGAGLESRATARGVTGASNLLFLGLTLSGLYLWLPGKCAWFRSGLSGKARDWNWHNTVGFWCVWPLLVIVASGVVMSYPWANNLVYRATGSEVPPPGGGPARGGGGRAGSPDPSRVSFQGIDTAWRRAESQVAGWKSIALRLPAGPKAPLAFAIDSGDGGRPDLRASLTLKRGTAEVVKWEPFSSNSAGRRLRSWIRYSHTGEAGGIPGETLAAIASLGAAVLVWTGISLAIRRLWRSIGRRRRGVTSSQAAA